MNDLFNTDTGNGIYDVVTQDDLHRWLDQKKKDQDRQKKARMTAEELAEHFIDIPY